MKSPGSESIEKNILSVFLEMNQIQDMEVMLNRILQTARLITRADAGTIYIRENDALRVKYSHNDTFAKTGEAGDYLFPPSLRIPIDTNSIAGFVFKTDSILNIEDMYSIPESAPYKFNLSFDRMTGYRTISSLTVPLKAQGVLLGVLQLINAQSEQGKVIPFSPEDERMMHYFAGMATIGLRRVEMARTLILRMVKMAELRDPNETGTHVLRVSAYAMVLYQHWGESQKLSPSVIDREKDIIGLAAMVHDVGKVAVSDTILKKPGRLTPEERISMQAHTFKGVELFLNKQSLLDEVSQDVIMNHHENWDGSGYPGFVEAVTGKILRKNKEGKALGKRREEIPLSARIVSLADVYDALQSKRSYKDSWDEESVFREINRLKGIKFDPELVHIFNNIKMELRNIQSHYQEGSGI